MTGAADPPFQRRAQLLLCLAACLLMPACNEITDLFHDPAACAQTGEFGNYGCILIRTRVIDRSAAPIDSVFVSIRPSADGNAFGGGFGQTDSTGYVTFRAIRVQMTTGANMPADTATVWISGVLPARGSRTTTLAESTQVRLRVARIGEVPSLTLVQITLPRP